MSKETVVEHMVILMNTSKEKLEATYIALDIDESHGSSLETMNAFESRLEN